jgi:hypothetical protein
MLKVDITEIIYTGQPQNWFSSTFSSCVDELWLAEFDLVSFNGKPVTEMFEAIQAILAKLRLEPENFTPADGDKTVPDAVREWLGEVYSAAYNHPEATLSVYKSGYP